jgi:hypothetical protein
MLKLRIETAPAVANVTVGRDEVFDATNASRNL